MGIYTANSLCYGFYTTATVITGLPKDWYIVTRKGFIIFVPHTMYETHKECPTIKQLSNENRVISMERIEKEFDVKEEYFNITDEERNKLLELAKNCNVDVNNIGKYIIEFMGTTLNNDFSWHINQMVKIV